MGLVVKTRASPILSSAVPPGTRPSPSAVPSPAGPWQRPGFGGTLRDGDPGAAPPPIPTHPGPYTRLGRLPARLPTAPAYHHAALPGGAASSRDVPRSSHRERSHGLRCALVGGEGSKGPRFARCPLRCGILAHGFARVRCDDCGHERLLAFSCATRGVCPSCNTRRMAEVAAHVTDHVLPHLPCATVGAEPSEAAPSLPGRQPGHLQCCPSDLHPCRPHDTVQHEPGCTTGRSASSHPEIHNHIRDNE